jgi:iron(III) transport system permease protein
MKTRGFQIALEQPISFIRTTYVNWRSVILVATAAVVFYLVLVPLIIALTTTFRPRGTLPFEPGSFTLQNYNAVFLDPATWTLMLNTGMFAVGSLVIGISFALILGWLVERSDLPYRNLMFAFVVAPMAIPGMMAAIAWIFLLHPRIGIFNISLRGIFGLDITEGPLNIYTLWGMIFVEGIRMIPTIFLMTSGAFRSMDPALEEASRVAGKSPLTTTAHITLPLMWPALLAALLYFLIRAIEVFEIPGVLGMNAGIHVFSTRIYWAVHHPSGGLPDYGLASTLGLLVVGISLVLIWLYYRCTRQSYKFATVTGKGFRPHRVKLGWWKHPAIAVCVTYFLLALVFPFFILLWTSLHKFYLPPSWAGFSTITIDSYVQLLQYGGIGRAAVNTILLAILTGTVTMVISFFVGWFVVRGRSGLTKTLDVMSFLPHSIPTIVIALGVMLMYLSFRNPFYGTIVIISIALTVSFLAYGTRIMAAGMLQIHSELEEASRVAGANWLRTYWRIILPLVAPAFINGWIWVAIHAGRELTAALMLYTPSSTVISTSVWNMWEQGKESLAAALAVILIMILILINWAGRFALGRMRSF